ncbi:YbjQ family protein [Kiloniella majae]|uniref:YbjQ family protein n=1 Tax=Kiloniella majae TaxID=1938558 RepID=UPI000A27887E|nr:YbjQ family protein [Kiloniella majae]
MQIVTTDSIEGKRIVAYKGIVSGDAIVGANFVKDFFAKVTDVLGGRAGGYEKALRGAKNHAMDDMIEQAHEAGANAIIGVDLDYESIGGSMLMVSANGTAVVLEDA